MTISVNHHMLTDSLNQLYPRQARLLQSQKKRIANTLTPLHLEVSRLRRHLHLMMVRETFAHSLQNNSPFQLLLNSAFPIPSKLQQEMSLIDSSLRQHPTLALSPLNYALAPSFCSTPHLIPQLQPQPPP